MKELIKQLVPIEQHHLLYEIGVYKITNLITGKIYIGSTSLKYKNKPSECGFYRRFCTHIWMLNKNKHANTYLQRAWNKYKLSDWKFEILEVTLPNDALIKEQYYLDILLSAQEFITSNKKSNQFKQEGYNLSPLAERPKNIKHKTKIVCQYTLDGNFIKQWSSITLAATKLNIESRNISRACKKHLTCGGFKWRYEKHKTLPIEYNLFAFDLTGNLLFKCNNYNEALAFYNSMGIIANRKMIIDCATRKKHSYYGYIWSRASTLNISDIKYNAIVFKGVSFVGVFDKIAYTNKVTNKKGNLSWYQCLYKSPFIEGVNKYNDYIIFKRFALEISTDINFYLQYYGYN